MKILEYTGLDTTAIAKHYRKVTDAIAVGDFRAAQVKKLSSHGIGKFYRAPALSKRWCWWTGCVLAR